ncbi:MAG: FkbM family methyltransferase [Spirosomataceae bacterium]
MKDFLRPFYHFLKSRFHTNFSATGEDTIIAYLFQSVGIARPSYLDIGAGSPIFGNNTYLFYKQGSKGVCVEANPILCKDLKKVRRRDVCLNYAVSTQDQPAVNFYVFNEKGISTLSKEEADLRERSGHFKVEKTIQIPSRTINHIIAAHFSDFPDYLSLDIEGMDLEVLKSLDFTRFPIPAICVETVNYAENHRRTKNGAIVQYLEENGYFLYADTFINSILVNKAWYFSGPLLKIPQF